MPPRDLTQDWRAGKRGEVDTQFAAFKIDSIRAHRNGSQTEWLAPPENARFFFKTNPRKMYVYFVAFYSDKSNLVTPDGLVKDCFETWQLNWHYDVLKKNDETGKPVVAHNLPPAMENEVVTRTEQGTILFKINYTGHLFVNTPPWVSRKAEGYSSSLRKHFRFLYEFGRRFRHNLGEKQGNGTWIELKVDMETLKHMALERMEKFEKWVPRISIEEAWEDIKNSKKADPRKLEKTITGKPAVARLVLERPVFEAPTLIPTKAGAPSWASVVTMKPKSTTQLLTEAGCLPSPPTKAVKLKDEVPEDWYDFTKSDNYSVVKIQGPLIEMSLEKYDSDSVLSSNNAEVYGFSSHNPEAYGFPSKSPDLYDAFPVSKISSSVKPSTRLTLLPNSTGDLMAYQEIERICERIDGIGALMDDLKHERDKLYDLLEIYQGRL